MTVIVQIVPVLTRGHKRVLNGMDQHSLSNDVAESATIGPYTGHFATNGLEMLYKLQLQLTK